MSAKKEKCYIAGYIGDLTEEEVTQNFAAAEAEVRALGYEPVNPIVLPHNHDKTWESYMKEDVIAMLGCKYLYACRNWRKSPEAKIEINLALRVGIHIIHQPPRREREEVAAEPRLPIHWIELPSSPTVACGRNFSLNSYILEKCSLYISEVTCPGCISIFDKKQAARTIKSNKQ